jgi:hypothetical protein
MEYKSLAVARPVELAGLLEIRAQFAAGRWDG